MGNMGRMASMDRLCDWKTIWCHQSPGTYHHMITPLPRPSLLQVTAALITVLHSSFAQPPTVNGPYTDALSTAIDRLICFRSLALFLYDLHSPKQCSSSCSTCLQILICTLSSAATQGEPEGRNGKEYTRRIQFSYTKTLLQKKKIFTAF